MAGPVKPIRCSGHAKQQLQFRGTTEQEIAEAIKSQSWQAAELGRLKCSKDFPFGAKWNGTHYATKQVRPIFVEEPAEIVVVTV